MASKSKSTSPDNTAQILGDRTPQQRRAQEWRIAAGRETIEAFVVAFILALLFRAFLAEAFVIPTGSMAPTLMGAHKDIFCDACGYNFRVGASRENSVGGEGVTVVGGVCPNCRRVNALDLAGDANDATFNGDRILVNKFSYVLSDPERWEVIVFKYPGNPKQNYIKRLVGLPNETLTIRHGDVYVRPTGSDQRSTIVRKPFSTLMAMSHLVHDTDHLPPSLAKAEFPSRWQPWAQGASKPPTDSWQVSRDNGGFSATTGGGDTTQWLRYFHHLPTDPQWQTANTGGSLADVDPYQSQAITDFYAYDSYIFVPSGAVYAAKPLGLRQKMLGETSGVTFNPTYQSGESLDQFGQMAIWGGQDSNRQKIGRDGIHWVGDLILQTEIKTELDAKEVVLELIEAGVRYRCSIDLASGDATLSINGQEPQHFDAAQGSSDANLSPTASTAIRAGQSHQIGFSNCDDQLLLFVDGKAIAFQTPTTFDSRTYRGNSANHPRYTASDPLDAAPAGVGVTGGKATIKSLQLHRDKYYISTNTGKFGEICDYDMSRYRELTGRQDAYKRIQESLASPQQWDEFVGWDIRRETTFELQEDQFFPMGDNSPESLDARLWAGVKDRIKMPGDVNRDAWRWSDESYVPRDLLVGRAIVVFWPHSWNAPVPFIPNVGRMKLIR